jgi:hypothetical protein
MTIEGRLVRAGVLDDRVDTDGVYPVTIEHFARRFEDARTRRSVALAPHEICARF